MDGAPGEWMGHPVNGWRTGTFWQSERQEKLEPGKGMDFSAKDEAGLKDGVDILIWFAAVGPLAGEPCTRRAFF
jgi:hypothetical protein